MYLEWTKVKHGHQYNRNNTVLYIFAALLFFSVLIGTFFILAFSRMSSSLFRMECKSLWHSLRLACIYSNVKTPHDLTYLQSWVHWLCAHVSLTIKQPTFVSCQGKLNSNTTSLAYTLSITVPAITSGTWSVIYIYVYWGYTFCFVSMICRYDCFNKIIIINIIILLFSFYY